MRGEGGGIGAAMRGESEEGMRPVRCPNPHRTIPATRQEAVFGYQVPVDAEDFAIVFFPVLDGEVVQVAVEELDAAVSRRCEDLALVHFRPGEVVQCVLRSEPVCLFPGRQLCGLLPLRG